MKWLYIILSIYLMALSCLPCADMEVNSLAHSSIEHPTDNHKHSHSHDKHNDLCSPFCSCNCCGTQIISYQPAITFDFLVISAVIKSSLPSYKSVFTSNFYGSIWQPPQLV